MEIEKFIESGYLELYVLGHLTEKERGEIDKLRAIDKSVNDEIVSIENTIENIGSISNIEPNSKLVLSNILQKINPTSNIESKEKMSFNKYYAIAASVIFGILGFFIFSLYLKTSKNESQLSSLNDTLKNKNLELSKLKTELDFKNKQLSIAYDTSFVKVVLKQTKQTDTSNAVTIFWNKNNGEVYSKMANLPILPNDKQYQLWALKDGKPIDLGVMKDSLFQQQFNADSADAFAITVENKGGSPTPTLAQLIMLGEIYE